MLSIIIPSFHDPYLQKTIDSILKNAKQKIEVIPIIDGFTPEKSIKNNSQVRVIRLRKNHGMRGAFNAGLVKAKGKYIMKCDSHCAFGPGFDQILTENCAENWLVIPRRYSINEIEWINNTRMPYRDYYYLTPPLQTRDYGIHLSNQDWPERTHNHSDPKYDIDDTMSFEGSCWLANKKYFLKHIGYLDDSPETYGPFADEPQEIGLKYWLGGGVNKVIKKTWYAHLVKRSHHYREGIFSRQYKINRLAVNGHTWSAKHWFGNNEPKMIHPFSWLVEKFWPVPLWLEDRKLWVFPKQA